MRNEKSGIGNCIGFLVFLFLISYAWAQDDEARPLRTVPPDPSLFVSNFSFTASGSQPQAVPSSLLTADALRQPLTQSYIAQYASSGGIEYLNAVMERANIFLPYIREEVARRNMPPELAYLPVIESSFEIMARSRSGAVGLWQFMMNSISPFDIKVNDFVDERRDFIKSTGAALQKLEDNYRILGSWELALAAYNAGLGAITRTVQRTKIRDYWELCQKKELKQETEHYVPKLLAAAWVLSQPRRFGINVWHRSFKWTAIPLPRQVSLDILAEEADIEMDLLRRLNAQLIYGISPADSGFRLIIPAAHAEKVSDVLRREDLKLIRYFYHTVRYGDTLWSISRHYGTPLDMIEQHNTGISNRYLKIGETVVIPASGDVAPPVLPVVTQVFNGSHIVKKGETLWSLSRLYGLDPQILAEANDMRLNQILHEGRTLKVPIIE